MEKEIRNLGNIQIRAVDGESSRHIEGYALMFDTQSEYIGFYETIERGAVTQEMVDACDVFATFNHDTNKIFARSNMGKGSLTLTVDDTGLKYEFDAPNTALGDELIEYLKRGDIDKSSFAFYMNPDDDEAETWESKDGAYYRTIHKIAAICDVSPVWQPAYQDTSVSKRSLEKRDKLEAQIKAMINKDLDVKLLELDELEHK